MNKIGYVSKYSFYLRLTSANKCIELRLEWNESVNIGECWNMSKLSLCVVMFEG